MTWTNLDHVRSPELSSNDDLLSSYIYNKSTIELESDTYNSKSALNHIHSWRFLKCCNCTSYIRVPMSCRDRLCPICRHHSAVRIYNRYSDYFRSRTDLKHLILTTRSTSTISNQLIRSLRNNFHKFRRRKNIKNKLKGGMYFLETTLTLEGWHLHIHAIISSSYIPQDLISSTWLSVTTDSYICYIRALKNSDQAISHLLSYIHKIPDVYPHDDDYNSAFSGVRILEPFGDCRGLKVEKEFSPCKCCGSDYYYIHSHSHDGIVSTTSNSFMVPFKLKRIKHKKLKNKKT